MPVHLVAGEAWDCGLGGEFGVEQTPWSLLVQWRDEIADAALEVHGVASQAIVHEEGLRVMVFAQEDF